MQNITGINRRGLAVALPEPVRQTVADLPCDVLLDGEAIGAIIGVELRDNGQE